MRADAEDVPAEDEAEVSKIRSRYTTVVNKWLVSGQNDPSLFAAFCSSPTDGLICFHLLTPCESRYVFNAFQNASQLPDWLSGNPPFRMRPFRFDLRCPATTRDLWGPILRACGSLDVICMSTPWHSADVLLAKIPLFLRPTASPSPAFLRRGFAALWRSLGGVGAWRARALKAFEMELRVGRKYRLGRKVGSGSFGDIYLGTNLTSGEEVAIKLERVQTKHPQLIYEAKIYRILSGGMGIPNVRWYGSEGDYNVMVLDLLGPSLEDLFNYCGRR
eukprot:scaffold1272_cov250-Pinguiococcus_pyrenoidosus.AAC.15